MHHIYRLGLILMALQSQFCLAGKSLETNICIRNDTTTSHQITVTDIANYDWDGNSRPDKNFNNLTIVAGQTICRREEINARSENQAFTFIVDDTPTEMRVYDSVRECESGQTRCRTNTPRWGSFEPLATDPPPLMLRGERSLWWSRDDWFLGYPCNGVRCSLFEIR